MFSRSLTVLARARPPFANFYKSMHSTLVKTVPTQRMRVASVLWKRTAPRYGIRFSAPRVAAAKQIYRKEGSQLIKAAAAKSRPARRVRKARPVARRPRRTAVASTAAKKKKSSTQQPSKRRHRKPRKAPKKKAATAPRRAARRASIAKPARPVTPYAAFTTQVMKRARLPSTPTNRNRVFRMWLLTGQQRSLSVPSRVNMAVRLLTKDQKSKRRLSKKVLRKKTSKPKTAKRSGKKQARRATAKKAKSVKPKAHKPAAKKKSKKASKARKVRLAPRKTAKARRARKSAATAAKKKTVKSKSKARKTVARKAAVAARKKTPKAARKVARKAKVKPTRKVRKTTAKPRVKASRKLRKVVAKPKVHRAVSKKKKSAHPKRRRENPYIEFYRRVRMTGLLPNGPVVVGSRKIKDLWARTHALPSIDARVAQATRLLEAQTGRKAMTVAAPPAPTRARAHAAARPHAPVAAAAASGAASTPVVLKDIKVPSYYEQNPFGATYAALLPALQDIPSSTRMAHVAKAWSSTARKDDHRSAKQRIAAVAQELKK